MTSAYFYNLGNSDWPLLSLLNKIFLKTTCTKCFFSNVIWEQTRSFIWRLLFHVKTDEHADFLEMTIFATT